MSQATIIFSLVIGLHRGYYKNNTAHSGDRDHSFRGAVHGGLPPSSDVADDPWPPLVADIAGAPALHRSAHSAAARPSRHAAPAGCIPRRLSRFRRGWRRSGVWNSRALIETAVENGVREFISSTRAVFGRPAQVPVTEDTMVAPISPYGWSKLMIGLRSSSRPARRDASNERSERRPNSAHAGFRSDTQSDHC